MDRRGRLLLALAALAPVLSSCALVPQEDSVRTAPMLREYAQEEYEFAVVERGDLIRTEKVSARYVPVQEEALSFSLVDAEKPEETETQSAKVLYNSLSRKKINGVLLR